MHWLCTLIPYSSVTCCLLASLVKDNRSWKSLLCIYSLHPQQYCYNQHNYCILLISSCMSEGVLKKCLLRAKFRFNWIYATKNWINLGDWHCNNFQTRSNSAKIFHISCCDIFMNTIWKNEAILRWSLPKSPYFRPFLKKLPLKGTILKFLPEFGKIYDFYFWLFLAS